MHLYVSVDIFRWCVGGICGCFVCLVVWVCFGGVQDCGRCMNVYIFPGARYTSAGVSVNVSMSMFVYVYVCNCT